jgi:hypothetical protein
MKKVCDIRLFNVEYLAMSNIPIHTQLALLAYNTLLYYAGDRALRYGSSCLPASRPQCFSNDLSKKFISINNLIY